MTLQRSTWRWITHPVWKPCNALRIYNPGYGKPTGPPDGSSTGDLFRATPRTPQEPPPMIDLTDQIPFGTGANRNCFQHPGDRGLCLKVLQTGAIQARYDEQPLVKRLLGR